jgi:hypothetical protein
MFLMLSSMQNSSAVILSEAKNLEILQFADPSTIHRRAMMDWGRNLEKTRRRLIESSDFVALRDCGHDLVDGAILTAVNNVPFEMSFKCASCGSIVWFENLAWQSRKAAAWRLSDESRAMLADQCIAQYDTISIAQSQGGEGHETYTHP